MATETQKEFSAGGVIVENGKTLLIRMRNLAGELVWTFPKGHVEPGETPEAAALREVLEETGCACRITGELMTARYSFTRGVNPVDKEVRWYLMERAGGDRAPSTPGEIFGMKWCAGAETAASLAYPSDLELLELIKSRLS